MSLDAENTVQTMLAGKPDAMIVIDSERQIICATQTAAKLLGWGSQAGIGGSISVSEIWANIYDLDGQRIPVEEWPTNLALTAAQTVTRQAKIVYPNGKDGEVYISAAPVRAENGYIVGAIVAFVSLPIPQLLDQSIESPKNTATCGQIDEVAKRTEIFVHETANALNGVYWTAQMIQEIIPDRYYGLTNTLTAELDRIKRLLSEFRSLTRPTHLQLTTVQMSELLERIIATRGALWSQQGVRIVKEFSSELRLSGDRDKLQQLILNLCTNAVEAMPNGGILILRVYALASDIILEISDNGSGIPKGMDILELFTSTKPQGSGVGMYVVQQIIAAHHGKITYWSEEGNGTTFRITLPKCLS